MAQDASATRSGADPSHPLRTEMARLGIGAVAPGVWRVALPFPSPLAYSFCYLVEVEAGFIAIDLGWNSDEAWTLFQAGLARAGGSLDELVGVVVTHVHPDHYGLAERIRASSGAWLATHPAERPALCPTPRDRVERVADLKKWMRSCGTPDHELARMDAEAASLAANLSSTTPDVDLLDGATVPDAGGRLDVVHTPGHTAGSLCFVDRADKLLFTGDHVLPRISPNVSRRPTSGTTPLADYERSLDRLRSVPARLVMPGHEWQFDRLDGRLSQLRQHHAERLSQIESAVTGRDATVWEVAAAAPWSRPFETLDGRAKRSALGETLAHLERLAVLGRVDELGGAPRRWRVADRPPSADEVPT